MVERSAAEELRRERERVMMEEGKKLWKIKRDEQTQLEIRDREEV